jgi:hypothetical protein
MTDIDRILKIETLYDTLEVINWGHSLLFYAYDDEGELELSYDTEQVRLIADTLNKWLLDKGG